MHNLSRWLGLVATGAIVTAGSTAVAAPAWCSKAKQVSTAEASHIVASLGDSKDDDILRKLNNLVLASCAPEAGAHAGAIAKARTAWGAKVGITTDADWADVAEWTNSSPSLQTEMKDELSTKDLAKATPIDQYLVIAADAVNFKVDPLYASDMFEPRLSEAGRLAVIEKCAKSNDPVFMAACQPDIDAFDPKKLFDELRGDTVHKATSRVGLRVRMYALGEDLAKHREIVEKVKKLDEAYVKLFDIASSARATWMKTIASNTALLDTVQAAESAHFAQSRKGLGACDEPTYGALKAAAAKFDLSKLAKTKDSQGNLVSGFIQEQLDVLMEDFELNVAAVGVVLCGQRPDLGRMLENGLRQSYRGPRSAAFAMIARANVQTDTKDDKSQRLRMGIGPEDIDGRFATKHRPWNSSEHVWSLGGVIKGVRKTPTALEIDFTPIWVKYQDCTSGHYTDKIDHIDSNGRVAYQYQCTSSKEAKMDDSQKGMKLDLKLASVIKPGVRVAIVGGAGGGGNGPNAELVAAWTSASQAKPSWLFGAVVK